MNNSICHFCQTKRVFIWEHAASLWDKDKGMPVVSWPAAKWEMPTGFSDMISCWVYLAATWYRQHSTAQACASLRSTLTWISNSSMYNSLLVRTTTGAKTRHLFVLNVASEQVDNHKRNYNSIFMFLDWIVLMVITRNTQTSWTCFVIHIFLI